MKTLMERRKHLTQSVFFLGGNESKQVHTQGEMRKYSETTTKKCKEECENRSELGGVR